MILTTTSWARESPAFADSLSQFETQVQFDVVQGGDLWHKSHTVTTMLLDSIRRNEPDYLFSPTANSGAFTLALSRLYRDEFRSRDLRSVGIIHNGFYGNETGTQDRVRDFIHRISRKYSPWSELHVVNPLLYDFLRVRGSRSEKQRLKLLPHPVVARPLIPKVDARKKLGIAHEGTFIGQLGKSDARKAIPELLAAFQKARLAPSSRLILAGRLYGPYAELIRRDYADLLRRDRLIIIDRYLTSEELHWAHCAMDVVSIAHSSGELSASLLCAVAAERPVIAHHVGYAGKITQEFGLGYATDVRDIAALGSAMEAAAEVASSFRLTSKARRLLEYHDPENFVNTLLRELHDNLGIPDVNPKTWNWAIGN